MSTPLVLLHPFPLDGEFWDGLVEALGEDVRVLTPHFPGFGGTGVRTRTSIAGHAEEVADLVAREVGEPAVVGGCSMGGYVAQAVAVEHPERVAGLILMNALASADPPDRRDERNAAIAQIESDGPEAFIAAFLPPLLAPDASEDVRTRIERIAERASGPAIAAAVAALRDRPDRATGLAQLAVPTLAIAGEHDSRTPPDAMAAMVAAIPNARLSTIPRVGHLAAMEDAEAVAAAIQPFLEMAVRRGR